MDVELMDGFESEICTVSILKREQLMIQGIL